MRHFLQAEFLLGKGQRAAAAGDMAAALAAYDRALSVCPDYAPAYLYRAICLSAQHAHGQAAASARQAVALDPGRPAYRLIEGRVAYDAGEGGLALACFAEVCRRVPANRLADAYRRMTLIRLDLPHPDPEHLQALSSLMASTNPAFQARWLVLCESALMAARPKGRTLVEQMIAATYLPASQAAQRSMAERWGKRFLRWLAVAGAVTATRRAALALEREAEARLAAGDLGGALAGLAEAVARRPEADTLQDKYLDLCLYQGSYAPILEAIGTPAQIAAIEDPDRQTTDAQVHLRVLLGLVRFHQGALDQAVNLLEVAAAADPLDFLAPYVLGACHLAGPAPETARHWFERAVSVINPEIARRRLEEWRRGLAGA